MSSAERRKKYLVEKKLQLKPAYLIAAVFVLITALIAGQIFAFLRAVLPHIAMLETKTDIYHFGILIMIQLFVIFLILSVMIAIYLHRFVGPLKRLERELLEMNNTEKYHLLTVRKNDALAPIIDAINKILSRLM